MAEKDPTEPGGASQPRGATPAELDELRVSVKVAARTAPPRAAAHPLPAAAQSLMNRAELDHMIDDGRALMETDPRGAHAILEKAYRKNLNDARVLSNYGLTLVMVEGDRQRGIRFCEEAVRRGLLTTEALVNLAKALVQTRNKEQAVRALRRAMELAPDDPRVGEEFAALGLRRPPVIAWLPRDFIINKWLGRLTWWFSRRHRLNPLSH
jgi:tetratricopeptide (TPR) repeat protein